MIVPMKKITLLCLASDTDTTLEALRGLGVLHVTYVNEPECAELDATRKRLERAQSAVEILNRHAASLKDKADKGVTNNAVRHDAALQHVHAATTMDAVIESVHTLAKLRREFGERISALREELRTIAPYGDFDPESINQLAQSGIHVKLYQYGGRKTPAPPEGTWMFPLSRGPAGQCFVLVGLDADDTCDACEFVPHHRSLSVVESDLKQAEADIDEALRKSETLTAQRPEIREYITRLQQQELLLSIRSGMGAEGKLAYLQGFCPTHVLHELSKAKEAHGWALLVTDPAPDEDVPTLLRNPAWVRPIKALFDLLGVTLGYKEIDISPAFLVFYCLFFAILVGDAGYGLIFLAVAFLLRRFLPRTPLEVTRLLGLLSACTILWGALTGTWFSITSLPAPLAAMQVQWLRDDSNMMGLCFLIGAIHLTLAHGWVAVRSLNRLTAIAEIGWIAITWTIFFAARTLILDAAFPPYAMWLFVPGVVAVILFMTPPRSLGKDLHKHIMLPLTLIGNFGDLVSYVRLFAVGSATAAISMAFNEMAIGDGIKGVGDAIVAVLILTAAHGLNLLLCALAVIVHGVRLNTLEFCGQMGIQWKGFKYRPFAETRTDEEDL